jgi:hypothetical protein
VYEKNAAKTHFAAALDKDEARREFSPIFHS